MKVHKGNRDCGYWQPPELPELKLPQIPRHRSKKDTKRWCLGKVGRVHAPVWEVTEFANGTSIYFKFKQLKCAKCKKVLKVKRTTTLDKQKKER